MLMDALSPCSKLTYWCGVLPDWCNSNRRGWISKTINALGIVCSMATLWILAGYETFQLYIELKRMNSVHSIMGNLLWFCAYPVIIVIQLKFLIFRKKMIRFFQDFHQLEHQPLILQYPGRYNWICRIGISFYLILSLGCVAATVSVIFRRGDLSVFLTHYETLCDLFSPLALRLFHVIGCVYSAVVTILMDVVPALVFYHLALTVQSLESAVLQQFVFMKLRRTSKQGRCDWIRMEFDKLWIQYEDIHCIVDEANGLFGFVVLLKDGIYFFATCILTYTVFYRLKSVEIGFLLVVLYVASMYSFRSVMSTLMAAQLDRSSRHFAATFSLLASQNWTLLSEEERKMAQAMMTCIQNSHLRARPCDLYDVNYTLLLRILSFTATYVIIILQSK